MNCAICGEPSETRFCEPHLMQLAKSGQTVSINKFGWVKLNEKGKA